jgi:Asp-tRNA(Asn)/Glu-tRNA(Gln) amidotransferase A subunit family amidase
MTMPGDLLSGALIEVARDLREKRVTARELIEAAIARHERFGERLHAYSLWAPQQARAVADAADAAFAAGVTVGPLQGIRFRSKTCLPPPAIPVSLARACGCQRTLGDATGRWSRDCAGSSGS